MFPMSAIRVLVDDRDMPAPRKDEDKVSTQASVPSLSGNSRRCPPERQANPIH